MFSPNPSKIGQRGADTLTFSLYLALVLVGWLMIYTVGAGFEGYRMGLTDFLLTTAVGKQTIWILISLVAFFGVFLLFNHQVWLVLAYPIYILTLCLLLLVLVFGANIKGATSWFQLGGFTIQPSELAKFGTCLAMAAFMNAWSNRMDNWQSIGIGLAIWMLPAALILLQPDAGSALVFASFLLVMYREGLNPLVFLLGAFSTTMFVLGILVSPLLLLGILLGLVLLVYAYEAAKNWFWYGLGAVAVLTLAAFAFVKAYQWTAIMALGALVIVVSFNFYLNHRGRTASLLLTGLLLGAAISNAASYVFNNVMQPHQQDRINVWLQPSKADARGSLYNVLQSQLAIAAGGLTGKGLTQGTMTKFGYVPEQQTDFIFCAVGEEQGFLGSLAVILLFFALLWRISIIAERQRSTFVRAYAYGVAGILFVHVLVNIGMTMGLLPVIGIPLPFLSKGGSSLLGFTIMLAVLLKLDKQRDDV